jgi:hypothetical protein
MMITQRFQEGQFMGWWTSFALTRSRIAMVVSGSCAGLTCPSGATTPFSTSGPELGPELDPVFGLARFSPLAVEDIVIAAFF